MGSVHLARWERRDLSKKLYVGNLPFSTTEEELRGIFEEHGAVQSCNVITEMEDADAEAATQALNGREMSGRPLRVNEAYDRRDDRGGDRGGRPRRD